MSEESEYALDYLEFLLREDEDTREDYCTFVAGFRSCLDALENDKIETTDDAVERIRERYLEWREDRNVE